jgi:hypothetical protein
MKVMVTRRAAPATKRIKLAWPETKMIVAVHPGRVPGAAAEGGQMRKVDEGRVLLPLIHTLTGTASPPPHTGNSH